MKKALLLLTILTASIALTSFTTKEHLSNEIKSETEWVYYTTVTAWFIWDQTESAKLWIYYKEGNGVRKYGYVNSQYYRSPSDINPGFYDDVTRNECYKNPSCNDFTKNYQYKVSNYVFNANLPYMQ